jgi:putative ABC transport system ATP-binding protein
VIAIEVRDVTKSFGDGSTRVEALRGIELSVVRGEFVAVTGPSGSGKSTLLHLIGGLEPPTSGTIRIGEDELGSLSDEELTLLRRRRIGFVFQTFNLLDVLSARENVAIPLVIDGMLESEANRRAEEALVCVNLANRKRHMPREMSGGEQQRVAIARALVTQPLIVLADEPTGNLDSANSELIMRLLRGLADDHAQTILMVTHDDRNAAIADRVVALRDGRIVQEHAMRRERNYQPE